MYKVYWTDRENLPNSLEFIHIVEALQHSSDLRNDGYRYVTMVSENPNSIGKPGVDAVENGKLPNGDDYTWRKRR